MNSYNSAGMCVHMRYRCIDLQAARSRGLLRKETIQWYDENDDYSSRGWIMGHLLRLASVPSGQIGGEGAAFLRACAPGCPCGVDVDIGRSAAWIKALCRTKSCHNAPCHCIYTTSYTSDATPSRDVITRSIPH